MAKLTNFLPLLLPLAIPITRRPHFIPRPTRFLPSLLLLTLFQHPNDHARTCRRPVQHKLLSQPTRHPRNSQCLLYYHTPQNNFCRSRPLNNSIVHYPKIIEFLNLQAGLPCRANNRNFGAENTALTSRSVQEIFSPGSCLASPIPDIKF